MVAVMTAAPLDMHMHGAGLGAVGFTLAAHTLGMFALAPVSGRLFDRYGARPVLLAGLTTLAGATVLDAIVQEPVIRAAALFLLGYGWNLCFVGGSGMLARDLPESLREHAEGAVDAAVWTIAAAASPCRPSCCGRAVRASSRARPAPSPCGRPTGYRPPVGAAARDRRAAALDPAADEPRMEVADLRSAPVGDAEDLVAVAAVLVRDGEVRGLEHALRGHRTEPAAQRELVREHHQPGAAPAERVANLVEAAVGRVPHLSSAVHLVLCVAPPAGVARPPGALVHVHRLPRSS